MRISVGAIVILLSVGVWCSQLPIWHTSRAPASVASETSAVTVEPIYSSESSAKEIKRETFQFKRTIDAKLDQVRNQKRSTRNFANVNYSGTFTVDWLTDSKNEKKRALIGFEVKTGGKTVKSSVPFLVEFLKDWVIERIDTLTSKNDADEDSLSILKDFVSIYAYRTQQDTAGAYEAQLTEKTDGFHYEKLRYSKLSQIAIIESKHDGVIDPKTRALVSIKGIERTSMGASADLKIVTRSTYELNRTQVLSVKSPKIDGTALTETSIQLEAKGPGDALQWSVVKSGLDQIKNLKKDERLSLFHDLIKTLKKDPAKLKEFKDWILSQKGEAGILNFGIGVMATLGSEESQKVLVDWFKEIPESRHTILNAFATADAKLTQDSKNLVSELVDQKKDADLAYNAAFTLGSAIRKDPTGDVSGAEQKLSRLYESAAASEQLIYLDAMGNSGSSSFAPVIERNLASTDEAVREKSVYAARFMKTDVAQTLIVKGLQDTSVRVRLSAVKAAAYQSDLSPYRPLLERYAQDTNEVGAASKQILNGLTP
jgi:hypothetical protein